MLSSLMTNGACETLLSSDVISCTSDKIPFTLRHDWVRTNEFVTRNQQIKSHVENASVNVYKEYCRVFSEKLPWPLYWICVVTGLPIPRNPGFCPDCTKTKWNTSLWLFLWIASFPALTYFLIFALFFIAIIAGCATFLSCNSVMMRSDSETTFCFTRTSRSRTEHWGSEAQKSHCQLVFGSAKQ